MAESKIPNQNAEQLITEHLDIWTTAIEQKSSSGRGSSKKFSLHGIKKLRELILELAVRGKLVPQDPNEEPASVLLERIAAEKAQLVKDKKIKKPKVLPEISEDEKPFELPNGWEWSRFDYLPLGYSVGLDRGKSQQGPDNRFRYFKMNNISNEGGFDLKSVVFVDASDEEVKQYTLKDHDLLFNTRNSKELVGKTCVYVSDSPEPTLYNNNILRAFFSESKLSHILDIWMRSPSGKLELEKIKSGTTNVWAIYQGKLALLHCIIPPLEEQERIVAKVDELMGLCDALEAQTENSIAVHQTLVEVLLEALLKAPKQTATPEQIAKQFQQNWQRLSEHFDTLFTTTASIDTLKQTILQLAVMGKLVPQNPNDEPANNLIKSIYEIQKKLIKEQGLKTKASIDIPESDKYIKTPKSWSNMRLGNLAKFIDYRGKTPTKIKDGVRLITAKNVRMGYLSLYPEEFISHEEYQTWMTRGYPKVGDLLFTPEAPLGNVALIDIEEKFALAQRAICFQFHESNVAEYIKVLVMSPSFQKHLVSLATGMTAKGIKASKLKEVVVPIPPLQEQHRIVAKVDELLTLCDQLKARLNDAQTTKLHLTDAIVEQAL